jgi:hypothetical protein
MESDAWEPWLPAPRFGGSPDQAPASIPVAPQDPIDSKYARVDAHGAGLAAVTISDHAA